MLDAFLPGALLRLPSDRRVRVVSLKGPVATCVYCTEAGEPDVQELEATVSLNVGFLRRFGTLVAGSAPAVEGVAESPLEPAGLGAAVSGDTRRGALPG